MTEQLFQKSWHPTWTFMVRKAVEDVEKLDRKIFSDPALGGQLAKVAEKYSVDVARLDPKGISAERKQEEQERNDGWGGRAVFKQSWLDVTIPFSGEAETLRVAPSRCTIPSHGAAIGRNSLVISISDDDNADRQVTTFCTQVNSNLDVLRAEYEQSKPSLEQAISEAAERRKQQIAAEDARDSKLSFPVRK